VTAQAGLRSAGVGLHAGEFARSPPMAAFGVIFGTILLFALLNLIDYRRLD
jgi:hypothetical protein